MSSIEEKKQSGNELRPTQTATEMFHKLRTRFLENLPDEDKEAYRRFGEKFHSSFDVDTGSPIDLSTINMEESLAYLVESLKSGLHPTYLTEDEVVLLKAGYGEEWYTKWGYTKNDLK